MFVTYSLRVTLSIVVFVCVKPDVDALAHGDNVPKITWCRKVMHDNWVDGTAFKETGHVLGILLLRAHTRSLTLGKKYCDYYSTCIFIYCFFLIYCSIILKNRIFKNRNNQHKSV